MAGGRGFAGRFVEGVDSLAAVGSGGFGWAGAFAADAGGSAFGLAGASDGFLEGDREYQIAITAMKHSIRTGIVSFFILNFRDPSCLEAVKDGAGSYNMNPKSGEAKRPMFGKIVAMLLLLTPNHFASVALYSSTLTLGIQRPVPRSSGLPLARMGKVP